MAKKLIKRVVIDLVPIRPGTGGAGSGIWIYAQQLIQHLDAVEPCKIELLCLINPDQAAAFAHLQQIRTICFSGFEKNRLIRVLWVHLILPWLCLWYRCHALHKLATETPLFCPARRVTTVHDFYYEFLMAHEPPENIRSYERLENFYFSLMTRICFHKSRAIIAVSEATCSEARTRYPAAATRIHVVRHGAPTRDVSLIPPRQPSPVFTILCVAKFMEHKGQHLVIEAFEALLAAAPERVGAVRLRLRGFHNDSEYFQRIEQQIATSRWADAIEVVPFCSSSSLGEIYDGADAVVLLSSYEGFGLPLLEAQRAGIPLICSDLPVLREIAGNGAFFVTRGQPVEMVQVLIQLMDDETLRQRQIAAGLENVKRFDWQRAAQETLAVYQKVLL